MATSIWKPIVIVLVLALCALSLYPLDKRLKPGIDLAGGTTLVYAVDLAPDANAEREIDGIIEVLKRRLDPTGTANVIMRRQGLNRIEIQLPLAPAETRERRKTFQDARDALEESNITRSQLSTMLTLDAEQQKQRITALAGGNASREQLLTRLALAHAELELAQQRLNEAQEPVRGVQSELDRLPADAEPEKKQELEARLKTLREELVPLLAAYDRAKRSYDAAMSAVMNTNLQWGRVYRALSMPVQEQQGDKTVRPREEALKELKEQYPQRAEQIDKVAQTWAAYDEVRGPFDDPADVKALLRGSGVLEFRIAAQPGAVNATQYRQDLAEDGPFANRTAAWAWFEVDDVEQFADTPAQRTALSDDPAGYFTGRGLIGDEYAGKYFVLLGNTPRTAMTHGSGHPEWSLSSAGHAADQRGFPAVSFGLDTVGGRLMRNLTSSHINHPMAIVLDGRVISAPNINDEIGGNGIITQPNGGFSDKESRYLVRTLKAGSLTSTLGADPVLEQTTGPEKGRDNLMQGLEAAIGALIIVAVFMLIYYFFAGAVADFALAANMIIILGVMATLNATWTLPGIAGIVLTIGMAVDANVLIFERIREELIDRQADLKTAVRLGYDKALSTILDANITTMITCIILGYTASAEIKGFAVTLGIGICATLFTALFCTRVIIDTWMGLFKPKTLPMLPTVVRAIHRFLSPNVNWIGMRKGFFTVSAIVMVAGIAMVFARGVDIFDIEFRGGVQVGFNLKADEQTGEPSYMTLDQVRQRLEQAAQEQDLPALAGATPVTVGDTVTRDGVPAASQFRIAAVYPTVWDDEQRGRTYAEAVSDAIKESFSDKLDIQPKIDFAGMGDPSEGPPALTAPDTPVYPITKPRLGENIGKPQITEDVSEFLGKVAIVLDEMQPASTREEVEQRIRRVRETPLYERFAGRTVNVIGLTQAEGQLRAGKPLYKSVAVVVGDGETKYHENPSAFTVQQGLAATEWRLVRDALQRDISLASVSNFSPQISGLMIRMAVTAIALSLLAIIAYIWLRFGSLRYGLAAIAALVHDVTITLGVVALFGLLAGTAFGDALDITPFRIDLAMIAAILTIIGYSLNDTIIVFDRIRENRGRLSYATPAIINDSINQTISRTVITSGTTFMAVLILYMFSGEGIHGFAFAMLVGVLVGTYSSVAIASPLLLVGAKLPETGRAGAAKPGKPEAKPAGA